MKEKQLPWEYPLSELSLLDLSKEQCQKYYGSHWQVRIITDLDGNTKEVDVWDLLIKNNSSTQHARVDVGKHVNRCMTWMMDG